MNERKMYPTPFTLLSPRSQGGSGSAGGPIERMSVVRSQSPADVDTRDPAMRIMIAAAKALPMSDPDPRIRERVLEAARASAFASRQRKVAATANPSTFRLPGWRWAWAAIFLVCTWGVYTELSPDASLTYQELRLENELLSLEHELETMLYNLEWELAYASEGWSS